jgi:hypothetical protein
MRSLSKFFYGVKFWWEYHAKRITQSLEAEYCSGIFWIKTYVMKGIGMSDVSRQNPFGIVCTWDWASVYIN